MFEKKGQAAIEFLILFVFIMIGLIFFSVVVGKLSVGLTDDKTKKQIDNYADSILIEFKIMAEVNDGYERTFYIRDDLVKKYNVSFSNDYLFLTDTESFGSKGYVYTYDLIGDFNLTNTTNVDGSMNVTIKKLNDYKYIGIELP